MSRRAPLGYQPALDGVRAFAVIAVMLYHSGLAWARGGYLGVDIFFALSGFLITGLLIAEWDRWQHLDLLAFWGRRARRLLPALVLVILAVSGTYVEPYQSPLGQVILVALLAMYVATLIWMRRMAAGKPLPRFLATRAQSRLQAPSPSRAHSEPLERRAGSFFFGHPATGAPGAASAVRRERQC